MSWNSSFELYPAPGEQGAVTNRALREIKSIVREYLSRQHTFDLESSPECPHIPGKSTIVNIESSPSALNVIGALAYDTSTSILYRDRGGGLGFEVIGGTDHGSLQNLTDDLAHPQYMLSAGDTISDIEVGKVTNLNATEVGYLTGDVMPYVLHIGEDGSGGAKHSDDAITTLPTDVRLSCVDKIDASIVESGPTVVAGSGTVEWLIGRMAFCPLASSDMTSAFRVYPLFSLSPPDDWVAGFTFLNLSTATKTFHMTAGVINA